MSSDAAPELRAPLALRAAPELHTPLALGHADSRIAVRAESWAHIQRARAILDDAAATGQAVYGLTTGLGSNVAMRTDPATHDDEWATLVGRTISIGDPLAPRVTRRALALRIAAATRGTAGLSRSVIAHLVDAYNAGIHPVVPGVGSIGDGDLGPSAWLAATVLGHGACCDADGGGRVDAGAWLRDRGLTVPRLAAKDALALFGTNCVALAEATDLWAETEAWWALAPIVAVASCDAYGTHPQVWGDTVASLGGAPGAAEAAAHLRAWYEGSWVHAAAASGTLAPQGPLSSRTLGPLCAAVDGAIAAARDALVRELGAAPDNPAVLLSEGRVSSTANFHPIALAISVDAVGIAVAHWANASAQRILRLVNSPLEGLPRFLADDPARGVAAGAAAGARVGLNALLKAVAATAATVRGAADPATLDAVVLSEGSEDVSTQLPLALHQHRRRMIAARHLLALEAVVARHAMALRRRDAAAAPSRATVRLDELLAAQPAIVAHGTSPGTTVNAAIAALDALIAPPLEPLTVEV
jgi:histidine ammonia-lyase